MTNKKIELIERLNRKWGPCSLEKMLYFLTTYLHACLADTSPANKQLREVLITTSAI
ncbi:MAG: hypothetical protein NZ931_03780 [Aigarchaeota archaeon]|nr:hypothetical protein [Aigarchaeota archaeon]